MKCRRLDSNGDYVFGNNFGDFIDGKEAIAQSIRTKVMLMSGEWWENISIGIPFFESILGNVSEDSVNMTATLLITQRILEIEEVVEVKDVKVYNEGRLFRITLEAVTTEGDINVEVG